MARLAGLGITFLVALGFELSGFENFYVALALWSLAGLWALGAFLTWRPVRKRLRLGRRATSSIDFTPEPEPSAPPRQAFDSELHALLSHGRGLSDDYLLGGGLPSMNRAQRDAEHAWTRDATAALNARNPAGAERFLAAQTHRERLRVLADILGVDEP